MTSFDWPSFAQAGVVTSVGDTKPLIVTTPTPAFTHLIASVYNLGPNMYAPDGAPLTAILNTGTVALPTGVTLVALLDNNWLVYDGIGGIVSSTGHTLTADNGVEVSLVSSAFEIPISVASLSPKSPHFPDKHFPGKHFPDKH